MSDIEEGQERARAQAGGPGSNNAENGDLNWRSAICVAGSFLALFASFGQMNAFGTFQTWYADHQLAHLEPSTIAWIGSMQLWTFFFLGGIVGRAFDVYGPMPLMVGGTVSMLASMLATSFATEFYQYFLAQGLLFGISMALLFYPPLSAISTLFRRYRATALGIASAGSGIGGVVYPILYQHLFRQIGFAWGVRAAGLLSICCCLVAVLAVKSDPPPKRNTDKGGLFQKCTISDRPFVLLVIGSAFVALGLFSPFFYLADYVQNFIQSTPSLSTSTSAISVFYVLSVINAGGTLGRIIPALLSDALGRFNLLAPSAFLAGLSCLVFWMFANSILASMLFAAVFGFLSGAFISLITPCVAQISEKREIGTRIGVLYSMLSVPSLLGGPIAGTLIQRGHGSYEDMIAFAGAVIMVGSLFIFWAKLSIDRRVLATV
ncbi:MFS general substrate transporter [Coniophora puteana RWD-64-598 SS2]|uniref:MFS general substrate transporter n=1 Tax=Coniophora puteana (strain RWD-64-598) TaxID=741705 RepID=A0A5M3MSE1_CONPW|nr:MFS general substrate transporter [Coniophora puteana RWD-64-598 SS2]EIW81585.1 MFS general substrate transporter [Coniophora puteana RWD-64-598 SS2]